MSLARLVHYAETNRISSPFYCTKLGSTVPVECRHLFSKIHATFETEFAALKREDTKPSPRKNILIESCRYLYRLRRKNRK